MRSPSITRSIAGSLLSLLILLGPCLPATALTPVAEPPTLEGVTVDEPPLEPDRLLSAGGLPGSDESLERININNLNDGQESAADQTKAQKGESLERINTDDLKDSQAASSDQSAGVDRTAVDKREPVKLIAFAGNQYDQLQSLTNQVLKKEMELLRLNTQFRIRTTKQGKFKRWRTFLYNLGASAVSFSGITTVTAENWRTQHNAKRGQRNTFAAGPTLLLIGHSIVLGGICIESGIDKFKEFRNWRKGLDPASTTKRVLVLQDEIDDLIKKRSAIVASYHGLTPAQKNLVDVEGRVLKDIRDLALVEYAQFYTRARKRAVSRDVSYINGSAIATTGGFQGSLNALLGILNKRRQQALPAGLGFLESGSLIVLAPWIKKGAAKVTGKIVSKRIRKKLGDLGDTTLQKLETDLRELDQRVAQLPADQAPPNLAGRMTLYGSGKGVFEQQAVFDSLEKKKGNREWMERVAFNALIGGCKMGWGTSLAVAGATYPTGGGSSLESFRSLVAGGSTAFVVGTSIWMLDTLQARTRGEMDIYTMGTNLATPIHKLQRRLDALNEIDKQIKL